MNVLKTKWKYFDIYLQRQDNKDWSLRNESYVFIILFYYLKEDALLNISFVLYLKNVSKDTKNILFLVTLEEWSLTFDVL